jgi:glycosyltransferase involved in cell wall biosynthesis
MKIAQVYNQQRSSFGGEETVIDTIRRVLERNGHATSMLMRSSRGSERSLLSKVSIAVTGVYNLSAYGDMQQFIDDERPDVVHVHSVYPNLSPSIFAACRAAGVPVVFHVHCHILTCPNWYHRRNGQICNRCVGGNEQSCLLTNCRGSLPESAAYAFRSFIGRKFGLFQKNVSLFIAVSHSLRDRLVSAGYPADQIEVVHNAVCADPSVGRSSGTSGEYIGYAGRLSIEKGVDTLIEAARICGLPVCIAGDGPELDRIRGMAPPNVIFLGRLARRDMQTFYDSSRFIVVSSRSDETFSLAVAEAMIHGKPVIGCRIGALPELIRSGDTGLLVETDNVGELAEAMSLLWNSKQLCEKLGIAAKMWAQAHCSEDLFYKRLMTIYKRAIGMAPSSRDDPRPIHQNAGVSR